MKMSDELYAELNNLLGHLEAFEVVKLVEQEYAKHNNPAPPELLKRSIWKLQKRLNEAEHA